MDKIKFNTGWQFAEKPIEWNIKPDWKDVVLPHDAQIFEPRCGSHKTGSGGGYFKDNTYLYQKVFARVST